MAGLKSKQIADFNNNITWASAQSTEIPNTKDIINTFVPESSMIIEDFSGNTISASTGSWQLTLSNSVQNDDMDMVTVYVNGVKTNGVTAVSGTTVTIGQYAYDIAPDDTLEVHYIKTHTVA